MKKLNLIFIIYLFLPRIYAQDHGFEGIIEYTIIFKRDPDYLQKTITGFRNAGWTEQQIKPFYADSARIRCYIKQDSIWEEHYLNNETVLDKINYQAGFQAEIINPYTGERTVLGKIKEIEDDLDKNSNDPNWREKIKVGEWFKTDYSRLKKLARRKEVIQGYLCQVYERPPTTPDGNPYYYWLTEDFTGGEEQQIPYLFNSIFTPKGTIVKLEMDTKFGGTHRILRKATPGPIDPILPRLRKINFGTLDSVQYADQKFNQHLLGKNLEQSPVLPDFSFYSVESNQLDHLYSRQDNGKFILLDFWGTWCAPCLKAMPQLHAFQAEHAAVLDIISLNQGDHRADFVQQTIQKHKMQGYQGYAGRALKAFLNPSKSIPYAILLDSNMKVRWRGNPSDYWEKLAEIVRGN